MMKIATFLAMVHFAVGEAFDKTDLYNSEATVDFPASRIAGGTELVPHSAPYHAAILVDGSYLCGGALITTSKVLTVASCVDAASFVQVRLGAHNLTRDEDTQVRIVSFNIRMHPNYNDDNGGRANDVAIVSLSSPVTLNDYIKTIDLSPADAGTYEGSWGLLTGWGVTTDNSSALAQTLRGVNVSVISNEDCGRVYDSGIVLDSHVCTSGSGIVGICDGDLGDPLAVGNVLIGLGTFAAGCESGAPSGYTRISSFRKWIDLYV